MFILPKTLRIFLHFYLHICEKWWEKGFSYTFSHEREFWHIYSKLNQSVKQDHARILKVTLHTNNVHPQSQLVVTTSKPQHYLLKSWLINVFSTKCHQFIVLACNMKNYSSAKIFVTTLTDQNEYCSFSIALSPFWHVYRNLVHKFKFTHKILNYFY